MAVLSARTRPNRVMTLRHVAVDEVIIKEGDRGDEMYIVERCVLHRARRDFLCACLFAMLSVHPCADAARTLFQCCVMDVRSDDFSFSSLTPLLYLAICTLSGEFIVRKADEHGVDQVVFVYTVEGSAFGELSLM